MLIDHRNVTISGGYWKKKMDLNRKVTMNAVYDRFHESGRIDAFRCDWKEGMPNRPHIFWDSDVAKWMEGAAYILETDKNPLLEEKVEQLSTGSRRASTRTDISISTTPSWSRTSAGPTATATSSTAPVI